MNQVYRARFGIPLLLSATAVLMVPGAQAQEVYKSIGPDGSVSYGAQPDAGATEVEAVELAPDPTPEQVNEARAAGERIEASVKEMGEERQIRQQQAEARREAVAEAAAADTEKEALEQRQRQQETLREYYGYRDYKFPGDTDVGAAKPPNSKR